MTDQQPRGGVGRWSLAILVVILLIAAGWWAGRATVVSDLDETDPTAVTEVQWAVAQETSVGRTVPVSVTVHQPTDLVGENHLSGVVTGINPGVREQGDAAYTVGSTPVRVIESNVPFWRDLRLGMNGGDVKALQSALADLDHLDSPADGRFGPDTRAAVIAWQKALRVPETGEVSLGEMVAVPRLPAQITLGDAVDAGRALTGGEEAIFATTGEYTFELVLGETQAQLVPVDASVNVAYQDHQWEGVISSVEEDAAQNIVMTLSAPDGGVVCGDQCSVLPQGEKVSILAQVVVVPKVSGVGIPTAAVVSDAQGQAWVRTREGQVQVKVLGAGQGVTIVEGLESGVEVEIGEISPFPDEQEPASPEDESDVVEEQGE